MLKESSNKISKSQRIAFAAIGLVVLVISVSSYTGIKLILDSHRESMIKDFQVRSNFLAKTVESKAVLNLMLSDTASLEKIHQEVSKASYGECAVSFFNSKGEQVWSPSNSNLIQQQAKSAAGGLRVPEMFLTESYEIKDNLGTTVGFMEFKNSTQKINQRLSDLRSQFIFIDFLFILFTLFICVWSFGRVMKYNRNQCEAKTSMKLAERNNELQKKFMAIMSHELRTPLNAISGFCSLIRTAKNEPEKTGYLNIINESANSMRVLVNDILDYTKITQDELHFNKVNFCLNDLMAQTVKMCEHKRREGVELIFEPQSKLLPVVGDANRLRQVLINLVSNALKFTFKGTVVVSYKTHLKGNEWSFYFEVKDSGVGIPEDKKANLFTPYVQAHLDMDIEVESTGLGLSICKRLIEKMGGNIGFTSAVGHGSNFFFEVRLPCGQIEDCNSYLIPKGQEHQLNGKILVVDDVHLNRLLLEKILSKWGLISVSAANGVEAIEKVKEENFDLILMDLEMPIMDGIQAAERIKKMQADLPILACSANPILSPEAKANMDGSVAKPINQAELAETLQRWLEPSTRRSLAEAL